MPANGRWDLIRRLKVNSSNHPNSLFHQEEWFTRSAFFHIYYSKGINQLRGILKFMRSLWVLLMWYKNVKTFV